jgi:tryptophanyl-tRNA synthetase
VARTIESAGKRILSAIQPSGSLTLGNYLGAVRSWVELQQTAPEDERLFCVADYHAITAPYEPAELRARALELVLDLLGCGIDPERSTIFLQSQVSEHTELMWILASLTSYGELGRMTQFKEKAARQASASLGLFAYPVLMAADVLAYKASRVPVGEDQLQHLELAREIARRFNQRFGWTFPEPVPVLNRTPRIMSLADPTQKMSKSLGPKHYVGVFEDERSVRKKIRTAVTDVGGPHSGSSPGVENLFRLLAETAPAATYERLESARRDGSLRYVDLKEAVAESVLAALAPLRERRARVTQPFARAVLERGAARARAMAGATLEEVRERIGILSLEPEELAPPQP